MTVEYGPQLKLCIKFKNKGNDLGLYDKLSIGPKMTALLLMDFQRMVVDSYAIDKATVEECIGAFVR